MTARQLANRIGTSAIAAGVAVGVAVWFLEPPQAIALFFIASGAISIWWGVHLLVTERPW